jgi:hypothetical protein
MNSQTRNHNAKSQKHHLTRGSTRGTITSNVKYWEIIADNLSKAGWSSGCVSAVESDGRTIFVADAHRDDGKRFVVRADEKLTAFVELESVTSERRRPKVL